MLFRAEETLKGGWLPPHGATGPGHAAFRINREDFPAWKEHLRKHGVEIALEYQHDPASPPSVYFRDPDGNILELAVPQIWPFSKP